MNTCKIEVCPQPFLSGKLEELQQHLKETRYENRILFEHAQTGIALISDTGRIVTANGCLHQLSGYAPPELAGLSIDRICPVPLPDKALFHLDQEGQVRQTRTRLTTIRSKTGVMIPARYVTRPVRRNNRPCMFLFVWPQYALRAPMPGGSHQDGSRNEQDHGFVDMANHIIGTSDAVQQLCSLGNKVARSDCTVLIQGESGTGKEVFAKAIHRSSRRASNPFVCVNCVALSDTLLESELFGHVKGAFTGAIRDRKGRFQQADQGTILLDEIGSMSMMGQAKLLRVLQEREFEPVGSSRTVRCNVRIVATTNVDLQKAVQAGLFRNDLYYRLSVMTMELPPLRNRKEDIALLAGFFLQKYGDKMHKRALAFTPETISVLLNYDWPGNVRELKNVIEQCVVISESPTVEPSSLPARLVDKPLAGKTAGHRNGLGLRERLKILERHIVMQTLRKTRGVKKKAARELGIDPRNFNYFLKKHGIPAPDEEREGAPCELDDPVVGNFGDVH